MKRCTFLMFVLCCTSGAMGQVSIDQLMSADELKATGVATLSPAQRKELDRWLDRYTKALLEGKSHSSECTPAIETQIDGDFNGWEGETIYKLQNGQIWEQASYHYHYHYAYAPEVTIYSTAAGCAMHVDGDDDQAVQVRRLK